MDDVIKKASQRVIDVFNALPRPKELANFDVWQMIHDDYSGAIFQHEQTRDIYYSWVCAKILRTVSGHPGPPVRRHQRFAVGIQWTGDQLEADFEIAIGTKVTRAVLGFCDMAEEFEEGGPLPMPCVGVPLLAIDRPVRISGIWLRKDGVLIEKGSGHRYHVIKEVLPDLSADIHASALGIRNGSLDSIHVTSQRQSI